MNHIENNIPDHPPFSVCMIARNEAKIIGQCLDALKALQCELVVMDTGSTDDTVRIARSKDANVFSYVWTDDFSAARNHVAALAANDLILAVDADEVLTEYDIEAFSKAVCQNPASIGMISRISPTLRGGVRQSFHERVGRFYDRTLFHYAGTIHENLTSRTPELGNSFYDLPLTFLHSGYEDQEKIREKAVRDLELLRKELQTEGDSPYLLFASNGVCT
ncbi:MAG: glycosyltransferase family 2 protein [Butyrivibrio sp.]|nr:glycosyltransferase family 2 protein [Butyrivibrio sp.]